MPCGLNFIEKRNAQCFHLHFNRRTKKERGCEGGMINKVVMGRKAATIMFLYINQPFLHV